MDDSDHLVRDLYIEAAAACGDDVRAIERYVETRVAAMDSDDRQRVRRVTDKVLAFRPPDRRPGRDH